MELIEHTFEELSELKYHIYTTSLPNFLDRQALIIAFEGEYGYGCQGNDDAEYIEVIIAAAEAIWESSFFILDYRSMTYEWGDMLPLHTGQEQVKNAEERKLGLAFGSVPKCSATLIPDRNREAVHSLMASEYGHGSDTAWLFDDLASALIAVEDVWRQFETERDAFLERADLL